ncbi:MAG: hypothetical protein ACRD2I_17535 [Vicinamibacterales bacterium]
MLALSVVARMSSGRPSPSRNEMALPATIAKPSNTCACARPILKIQVGDAAGTRRIVLLQIEQPIVLFDERGATKQDRVHDGKHGDVEAYGKRQHGDGRDRERAVAPQPSQRKAQIMENAVEPCYAARVAMGIVRRADGTTLRHSRD